MNTGRRRHPPGLDRHLHFVTLALLMSICAAMNPPAAQAVNLGALTRALRVAEEGSRAAEGAAAAARAASAARALEMASGAAGSAARAGAVFRALPVDAARAAVYVGREAGGAYVLIVRGGAPTLHGAEGLARALDALDAGGTVPLDLYVDMPAALARETLPLHRPGAQVYMLNLQPQAGPAGGGENTLRVTKDIMDVVGMANNLIYGIESTGVRQMGKEAGDRPIGQSDAPVEDRGKGEESGPGLLWGLGGVALLVVGAYLSYRLLK
jgi:hypothetical protein